MSSRRVIRGKSKYQKDWEDLYPWARPVKGDVYSARCILCASTISVDTMGRSALKSHSEGTKPRNKQQAAKGSAPMEVFMRPNTVSGVSTTLPSTSTSADSCPTSAALVTCGTSAGSTQNSGATSQGNAPDLDVPYSSTLTPSCFPAKPTSLMLKNNRMTQFLLNESTTKAEAMWAIQTVMNHTSLRAAANCSKLFPLMFPDSDIAKRMSLQKDKLSYIIVHGLCPYFKSVLEAMLLQSDYVVLGFDESLNKISHKQQMDLGVRFWSTKENRVTSRFLASAFLNHTTSEDLLKAIKQNIDVQFLKKVIQLSMDGPNVNVKLQRLFVAELRSEEESPQLLELGSCGLHTLHNAFKTGIKKTGWELVEFFRAAHNLFKFAPARRGDYTRLTGSTTFPLPMCAVRWLENGKVARRLGEVLPHLEKYVKEVKKGKNEPACNSFFKVSKFLEDKLIRAKIAFFESLCDEVEGFLGEFQTDAPMAPFLYSSLSLIIRNLMSKIVKDELMMTSELKNIDVFKKDKDNSFVNLKTAKTIDLGYFTRSALRKCTGQNDRQILQFRQDCRTAFQFCISKLMEKSPLKYPLTKALQFLDPRETATGNTHKFIQKALDIVLEANLMPANVVQKADREFVELCSLPLVKDMMASFDRREERLDDFWLKMLRSGSAHQFTNLGKIVKLLLTLSHGNANIERGFSINKEILIENMKEQSLVAQRTIFDAVSLSGGIEKVDMTDKMLHSIRSSHSKYRQVLEDQKKVNSAAQKEVSEKRKKELEAREIKAKKQKLVEETNKILSEMDERLNELKK